MLLTPDAALIWWNVLGRIGRLIPSIGANPQTSTTKAAIPDSFAWSLLLAWQFYVKWNWLTIFGSIVKMLTEIHVMDELVNSDTLKAE